MQVLLPWEQVAELVNGPLTYVATGTGSVPGFGGAHVGGTSAWDNPEPFEIVAAHLPRIEHGRVVAVGTGIAMCQCERRIGTPVRSSRELSKIANDPLSKAESHEPPV